MYIAQSFDKKGIWLTDGEKRALITWDDLDKLKKGEFKNLKGQPIIVPNFELFYRHPGWNKL